MPLALLAALLLIAGLAPATSLAAVTAPTLTSPDDGFDEAVEGNGISFEWDGELQGDPGEIDRSFWRLEIIDASDVPSGTQSTWSSVETLVQTTPGQEVNTARVGAPDAGTWSWRVCAWGVADADVSNDLEQLDGGCSTARTITTSVATTTTTTPGQVILTEHRTERGATTVITQTSEPDPVTPEPVPDPVVETTPTPVPDPVEPAVTAFQKVLRRGVGSGSAVGLSNDGLTSDPKIESGSITGALLGALSKTLPVVPIPLWTVALIGLCMPIAKLWRRGVLAMFDWPDGSIDGRGTGAPVEDLQIIQDDQMVKDGVQRDDDRTSSDSGGDHRVDRTAA